MMEILWDSQSNNSIPNSEDKMKGILDKRGKLIDITEKLHEELYDFCKKAEDDAKMKGCKVVYPKENQLQLDIDNAKQFKHFWRIHLQFQDMLEIYGSEICDMNVVALPSKSGGEHLHVTIDFFDRNKNPVKIDPWMRIALQFMFGSDPVREKLNIFRLLTGDKTPCRLFEKL